MRNGEVSRAILWTVACSFLLLASRQWVLWRMPQEQHTSVQFEHPGSLFSVPDTDSKLVVMQIPVRLNRRLDHVVEVPFELELPCFIDGVAQQRLVQSDRDDRRIATGTLTFAPFSERACIQLSTNFAEIANQQQTTIRLLPPEPLTVAEPREHLVDLMPSLSWELFSEVAGKAFRSKAVITDDQRNSINLMLKTNRVYEKDLDFQYSVMGQDINHSGNIVMRAGETEVSITDDLLGQGIKPPFGTVDIRVMRRSDVQPRTEQRWLEYPMPKMAALKSLTLRTTDGSNTALEGQGEIDFEVSATFDPGQPIPVEIDLMWDPPGDQSPRLRLNDKALVLPAGTQSKAFTVSVLDDKIPSPSEMYSLVARSGDVASRPLSISLEDDDVFEVSLRVEPESRTDSQRDLNAPIIITEEASPAGKPRFSVILQTTQKLPESGYSLSMSLDPAPGIVQVDGRSGSRMVLRPTIVKLTNDNPSAKFEVYANDDQQHQEDWTTAIRIVPHSAPVPSAGVRLPPLRVTLRDEDKETPPPASSKIAVLVIYNPYLQEFWDLKRDSLSEIIDTIGKENLASRSLIFVGAKVQFPWQQGTPPPIEVAELNDYEALLTRIDAATSAINENPNRPNRAVVLWFQQVPMNERADVKNKITFDDKPIQTHLLWVDGPSASRWLFNHYMPGYTERWGTELVDRSVDFFPASSKPTALIERVKAIAERAGDVSR
ncbi:MAG TPA: hypothetical protein DDZ51_05280 [Planctomycetaceae bacterium]|nr:hypothetical protein [Planctomycetaceae bacterium]